MQSPDILFDDEVVEVLAMLDERGLRSERLTLLAFTPIDIVGGAHKDFLVNTSIRRVLIGLVDAGYASMTVAELVDDPSSARLRAAPPLTREQEEMDIRLRTQHEVSPELVYRSKINR